MLNYRKEFFKVSLEEVEQKIKDVGFDAEFIKTAEAMEYRETLAIIEKLNSRTETVIVDQRIALEFPASL